jgi:uncharacterized membrane protein YdfJ with MMPL/SSD domain
MNGSARRLTGVVGRWSASHPWTAIAAWLGGVAVLLVAGHLAGTIQLPTGAQNVGPSGQAEQMISRDFPRHAVEDVLFDSPTLRVLLDATIVRALLLPATMKLLGPRNWYLPRWLGWLPRPSRPVTPPTVPPGAPSARPPVGAIGR